MIDRIMEDLSSRRIMTVVLAAMTPVLLIIIGSLGMAQINHMSAGIDRLQVSYSQMNLQLAAIASKDTMMQEQVRTLTVQNADQEHRITVLEGYHGIGR